MIGTPAGKPAAVAAGGAVVRPMTEADLPACAALCETLHGFDRTPELRDALAHFNPFVLERGGAIRAYASTPNFFLLNHGVAETPQDMQDLILGAAEQSGQPIGLQVPTRNTAFFRWCLSQKLRMLKPTTLMSTGEYRDPPAGTWWFPSIEY